jgi:HlyD family secretion protein
MLTAAEANVHQKQAVLAQAQVDLDNTEIRAPVDGVVVARNVDVGQTVAASLQAPTLFLIAQDLTKMQVDTNVDEADVGRVALDQQATFTVDSFPGKSFSGQVVQIRQAAQVVQNVVTYDCVVAVGNPELKLMPGMTANVKILVARRENALLVPNAVFRVRLDAVSPVGSSGLPGGGPAGQRGPQTSAGARPASSPGMSPARVPDPGARGATDGQQRVWVLQDGKPVQRMVRTGLSDGQKTEVLEGLKDGEAVILGLGAGSRGSGSSGSPPRLRL